ncbi:hypothetical protein, partial [Rhodococcus gordoniae]
MRPAVPSTAGCTTTTASIPTSASSSGRRAPGVGYATNEAGQDGIVNGVFVNEGSINHWCYGPPGMIHSGTGY